MAKTKGVRAVFTRIYKSVVLSRFDVFNLNDVMQNRGVTHDLIQMRTVVCTYVYIRFCMRTFVYTVSKIKLNIYDTLHVQPRFYLMLLSIFIVIVVVLTIVGRPPGNGSNDFLYCRPRRVSKVAKG